MEWDSSASSQSRRLDSIPVARRMRQRAEIISATRSCSSRVTGLCMVSYFWTIRLKSLGSSQARIRVWLAVQPWRSELREDFFFPSADLGPWDLAPLILALSDCRSVGINNSCHECKTRSEANRPCFLINY